MLILSVFDMSSSLEFAVDPPRTRTIDDVQADVIQMKEAGHTHTEVLSWLQSEGLECSQATLEHRLRLWGVRRKATANSSDTELVRRVHDLFHETLLSDSQIALRLAEEEGYEATARQIKKIRLDNGWQRRYRDHGTRGSASLIPIAFAVQACHLKTPISCLRQRLSTFGTHS
jgi:hypothetical protein